MAATAPSLEQLTRHYWTAAHALRHGQPLDHCVASGFVRRVAMRAPTEALRRRAGELGALVAGAGRLRSQHEREPA